MTATLTWLKTSPRNNRPHWFLQAPPNVILRAKRIFERSPKESKGILISDTPENCRELSWFLERYPAEVSHPDRLQEGAQKQLAREKMVQGILCGEHRVERTFEMALPAREYQQVAADLCATTGRLLLGDDVGVGKTVSAIATMAATGKYPVLVVTLTHLPRQWQRELLRFMPGVRSHILKKGSGDTLPGADVIICNYHKLAGWSQAFIGNIRTVIFDECQELRRDETNKYEAAKAIADEAEVVLGLSATPIYNYGIEIFNIMQVIAPTALGDRDEFCREWCGGWNDKKSKISNPKAFGAYMRESGLMLRRTREDVGRELPALTTIPYSIDTDKRILANVDSVAIELARAIVSRAESFRGERFQASGQFDSMLRQATGIAKAGFVADFVEMLVESGEKVVLFGWHHAVYEMWLAKLKQYRPAIYTGRESPTQKEQAIARFTSGDTPVIILSIRAGAGLDGLQHHCRTVVFGELDWSPAAHEQAIGRVYRDGQKDKVCAYFLISDGGSDPIVADVLGVKRGQIDGIRDPNAALVEAGADPDHIRKLAQAFLDQHGIKEEKGSEPDVEPKFESTKEVEPISHSLPVEWVQIEMF